MTNPSDLLEYWSEVFLPTMSSSQFRIKKVVTTNSTFYITIKYPPQLESYLTTTHYRDLI